jgi:dihydrofolate reductase
MIIPKFNIIAAVDSNKGIGVDNDLPWKLPGDLKYFSQITKDSVVIMGRRTWDSLPKKPLSNRINIVVGSKPGQHPTIEGALQFASNYDKPIFVIGGARIYDSVLKMNQSENLFLTEVWGDHECDRFFPKFEADYRLVSRSKVHEENGEMYTFNRYVRRPSPYPHSIQGYQK